MTLNFLHPGRIATDRVIGDGTLEEAQAAARDTIPAGRLGAARGDRRGRRVPLLRARLLHHGHEPAGGRRAHPQRQLSYPQGESNPRYRP